MSAMLKEIESVSALVDDLTYINYATNRDASPDVTPERWARIYPNAQAMEARYQSELVERGIRERMQVLEAWRALAADGFEREAIAGLAGLYQDRLNDMQWAKRFPGPKPATDGNDPDYWRAKSRELRAEGEGLPMLGCESAMPHLHE